MTPRPTEVSLNLILLGPLLGPEFLDSNSPLCMGMTIEVSIYAVCGTFCRLLWVVINRGVVPGAGIESSSNLLIILINNYLPLLHRPSPRPSDKPLTLFTPLINLGVGS